MHIYKEDETLLFSTGQDAEEKYCKSLESLAV